MAGYGSDEGFATYADAAGYTVPTGTVATARQRGSDYIDAAYADRWPGEPAGGFEQLRAWPRSGAEDRFGNAIDASTVPTRVVNAAYEAALLELTTPGSLSALTSANEKVKRLKAGSVEIEYAESELNAIEGAFPISTKIEGLLHPIIGMFRAVPAVLVV